MGLLACVNIPQLKLQLYGRHHPELRPRPMAVISEDRPLGIVLEANRTALDQGIRPGMRYASALSLVPALQAAAISDTEVQETILALSDILFDFSPSVEPACLGAAGVQATGRPAPSIYMGAGTFWLNAEGLFRIFGSPESWTRAAREALVERAGFTATIAVGATRFATYAASRLYRRNTILTDTGQEQELIRRAPLRILPFDPRTTETLIRLGIHTVHDFIALPSGGVRKRFGEDAAAVHRFAQGLGMLPVQTPAHNDPLCRTRIFASPVVNKTYLNVAGLQLLDQIYEEVTRRRELIKELHLILAFETGRQGERPEPVTAFLRPAAPTIEKPLLSKLLRLRVEGLVIAGPVEELSLSVTLQRARHAQAEIFSRPPERDAGAADKAFALIRAELGNEAVCAARLLPEHLPRERYRWEPLEHLPPGAVGRRPGPRTPLMRVRRLFGSPQIISPPASLHGTGAASKTLHFSGTWWGSPYKVAYRYFAAEDGALLWLEQRDGRWIIQGSIE